ncbi:hypothetical protein BCV69DRAFT_110600 [Microstroma glucosiphilum]|uniref:Uncharacterized protein n=1 Tax=Pseudomicrostroma glucosiphilum TaxID=1684307 RepID=A0A316UD72_9BASI|nr:hypothetical protein BCV69DRAFT_110600 [Pseudomicrostroma glucosiphilum]PWN23149.1 hypothetical protein BCV69DRAFT_110600 [Pseudomicrostroma glucosiphilum]
MMVRARCKCHSRWLPAWANGAQATQWSPWVCIAGYAWCSPRYSFTDPHLARSSDQYSLDRRTCFHHSHLWYRTSSHLTTANPARKTLLEAATSAQAQQNKARRFIFRPGQRERAIEAIQINLNTSLPAIGIPPSSSITWIAPLVPPIFVSS